MRVLATGCCAALGGGIALAQHFRFRPPPLPSDDIRLAKGRRVCVVGAGVVGLSSAYQLAKRGFDVTVLDAGPSPATGASAQAGGVFARARRLPTWETVLPQSAESKELLQTKRFDLRTLLWNLDFWRFAILFGPTTLALLMDYTGGSLQASRTVYGELLLRAEGEWDRMLAEVPQLRPADKSGGWLRFYRNTSSFEQAAATLDAERGHKLLTPEQTREMEPLLRHQSVAGAVLCPQERWAHPGQACSVLESVCKSMERPVQFVYGARAAGFDTSTDKSAQALVLSDGSRVSADVFVLCTGDSTTPLARSLGVHLPVFPLRGYTAHVNATDSPLPPQTANPPYVWDVDLHSGIGRFGDTVRVSGGADFTAAPNALAPKLIQSLREYTRRTLGLNAGARIRVEGGGRPLTPDWAPCVGPICPNVWVNVGHGTAGWTLSWACAPLLAKAMCGEEVTEVDLAALSPLRFDFFARMRKSVGL